MTDYFPCAGNKTKLHNNLRCDGVHQCQAKDDEDPYKCQENYIQKGIMDTHGDFRCITKDKHHYPNLTILAVRCNGNVECLHKEDEENCGEKTLENLILIMALAVIVPLCLWGIYIAIRKIATKSQSKPETDEGIPLKIMKNNEPVKNMADWDWGWGLTEYLGNLMCMLSRSDLLDKDKEAISELFEEENMGVCVTYAFLHLKNQGWRKLKTTSTNFIKIAKIKFSDKTGVCLWMKNNIEDDISNIILNNSEDSFLDKHQPVWLKDKLGSRSSKRMRQVKNWLALIKGLLTASWYQMDFTFDGVLVYYIFSLIEEFNLGSLPFMVFSALIVFIHLPLVTYLIKSASTLFSNRSWKIKLSLLSCFPALPYLTMINNYGRMIRATLLEFKIKTLICGWSDSDDAELVSSQISKDVDELQKEKKELKELKEEIAQHKIIDSTMEGQPQIILTILLILLFYSQTKVLTGTEALFGGSKLTILGISTNVLILASVLSKLCKSAFSYQKILTNMKTKSTPTSGKILLYLFVFCTLLPKYLSLVAIFTPPLGLFSILGHWQTQQIPYSCSLVLHPDGDGLYRSVNDMGQIIVTNWSSIAGEFCINGSEFVRLSNKEPVPDWSPVSSKAYIPMDLPMTFLVVLCVTFIRMILVLLSKLNFAKNSFNKESKLDKFLHILQNSGAIPLTSVNWEESNTLSVMRTKYLQQKKEMVSMLALHCLENLIFLLPLTLTFIKIYNRHSLLEDSVGLLAIEKLSYNNCVMLLSTSYTVVVTSFFLQTVLFSLYSRYGQMWKCLLEAALEESKEFTEETGQTEIQEKETCVETCLSTKEEDTEEVFVQETNVLVHREEVDKSVKENKEDTAKPGITDQESSSKENLHDIKVKRIYLELNCYS